ncbi:MAG TPA: GntR family transcriptional regulator [Opitutaceae bacterium]|nr:GntR family transcriptional regulator [Opitutaceae bacterium]
MTLLPHRTVASQLTAQLRAEIRKGTWRGWLPAERSLAQLVHASRNTLRTALEQLVSEGVIEIRHGIGARIRPAALAGVPSEPSRTIGILVPDAIGSLRPLLALWIDELKDLLVEEGWRVRVHDGRQFYQRQPNRALERLTAQHPHDAWVLTLSSEPMQRWFARHAVPCLVVGSVYPEIALPFVDLDYHAACRHAAGVLLRLGHTRLALLNRESRRAGDVDSERGFTESVRSLPAGDVSVQIAYHRDDVDSVNHALGRLLDRPAAPTAIVVSNSYAYLATASLLALRGLRIPRDISLISRDDDPFLRALAPAPARYVVSPHTFATRIIGPVLRLANGEPVTSKAVRLLPKYVPGGSVASPRR